MGMQKLDGLAVDLPIKDNYTFEFEDGAVMDRNNRARKGCRSCFI